MRVGGEEYVASAYKRCISDIRVGRTWRHL
jgi:hypothetical protein